MSKTNLLHVLCTFTSSAMTAGYRVWTERKHALEGSRHVVH